MNQKERIRSLLKDVEGQPLYIQADYLVECGVHIEDESPNVMPNYNFDLCPHMCADRKSCRVLTNMICRDPYRGLPCGFFPEEALRRRRIYRETGSNTYAVSKDQ